MSIWRYATRSDDGVHTWRADSTRDAVEQHHAVVGRCHDLEVWPLLNPSEAPVGQPYMLQIIDDDWNQRQAPIYRGVRTTAGVWTLTNLAGEHVAWTYNDADVLVRAAN